jgi:transketolase
MITTSDERTDRRSAADPDRLMITLENHTVVGGLGEAVAATVAYAGLSRRLLPIGLPDEFLAAGALPTLHDRYGLSTEAVIARVKTELSGSGESALPAAGS